MNNPYVSKTDAGIFVLNKSGGFGSGLLSDTIDIYEEIIDNETDPAQTAVLINDLKDIILVAPSILGAKQNG